MGVIDKVSVGGTTYDIRDSKAGVNTGVAFEKLCIVDYPFDAEESSNSTAVGGLTITRKGNKLTVNGTASSTVYCRMSGELVVQTSAPTAAQNASANAVTLNSAHLYRLVAQNVSGSASKGTGSNNAVFFPQKSGTTSSIGTGKWDGNNYLRFFDGAEIVLWFLAYSGNVFTNAVYEIVIDDCTENKATGSYAQELANISEAGRNLIYYRSFYYLDGPTVEYDDDGGVTVTAVGNTDYQSVSLPKGTLSQHLKVGHLYRASFEAEVKSGTPYIQMSVRGTTANENARVATAGPGSNSPSGTYSFIFCMNEGMNRLSLHVSETANNPGAKVRYYNIRVDEVFPASAVDSKLRGMMDITGGNEMCVYPDAYWEPGGLNATAGSNWGKNYDGNSTYQVDNRRTANYLTVDHVGYIWFYLPVKACTRIFQYDSSGTPISVSVITTYKPICFWNESGYKYRIQITKSDLPGMDATVPDCKDCMVAIYWQIQPISSIAASSPKEMYCIMTHNVGQWTTGAGVWMQNNGVSWIELHHAIIERYSPDIICFQEYLPCATMTAPYYAHQYTYNSPNNNIYSGKCIVSNMPLESTTGGVYENQASGNIACNWAKSYIWLNGRKVAIISTHLSTTAATACLQMAELLAIAEEEEYVIICGDFNLNCATTADDNYVNGFKMWADAGYHLANMGAFGFIPTYYTSTSTAVEAGAKLDNIIVSGNIDVRFACADLLKYETAIDPTKIDHMPFVAYVSFSES